MDKVIGVLGGGQLGRMLVEAANRLNIKVVVLDKAHAPAKQITAHDDHVTGNFKDPQAIKELAKRCDVLTIEIEHVDVSVLAELEQTAGRVSVQPSSKTIATIQDKYRQKEVLKKHGIPVADSARLQDNSVTELGRIGQVLGFPFMLKSRKDAYDGRGNFAVHQATDFEQALQVLGRSGELYAERWAPFQMELAVMVVQTSTGTQAFPTVETVHEKSICKLVYAPARGISRFVSTKAQQLARKAIGCFTGKGVFAVEMFLLPNDDILVNEIAPRPHNSGHFSIEGCFMSQYDAHLRAILDLPIPEEGLRLRQPSIMLNILGGTTPEAHIELAKLSLTRNATLHLYGKGAGSSGRKMGHITVTASTMAEAEAQIQPLVLKFDEIVGHVQTSADEQEMSQPKAQVAVWMGSDSDLPIMNAGIQILKKFAIPHSVRVTSAHRTPEFMASFAADAMNQGIRVIIAGAGGAAHLPGMVASHTCLPVIGVPVKASVLDGVDSLYSIVQMPRGVPVATVGINNSTNAALLAARILALSNDRVLGAVQAFSLASAEESLHKDSKLQQLGSDAYLEQMQARP